MQKTVYYGSAEHREIGHKTITIPQMNEKFKGNLANGDLVQEIDFSDNCSSHFPDHNPRKDSKESVKICSLFINSRRSHSEHILGYGLERSSLFSCPAIGRAPELTIPLLQCQCQEQNLLSGLLGTMTNWVRR